MQVTHNIKTGKDRIKIHQGADIEALRASMAADVQKNEVVVHQAPVRIVHRVRPGAGSLRETNASFARVRSVPRRGGARKR